MIGSLFSGADGLVLGLERATGQKVAWACDKDKHASTVLAARFPEVPNLGDITKVDWDTVEPVDLVCGGFPCQPFSLAGMKQGVDDERWMWPEFVRCLRVLRPRDVVVENVSTLVFDSRAFGVVIGDLAEMRYDTQWACLRASDVGAPHKRERLFIFATNADQSGPQGSEPERRRYLSDGCSSSLAYSQDVRLDGTMRARRWERRSLDGDETVNWGIYEPAIRRWESICGPAPLPVDKQRRLSPVFVEWLMGFPVGWVTDLPLSRIGQFRSLGNAVVPQVAELAWMLLNKMDDRG